MPIKMISKWQCLQNLPITEFISISELRILLNTNCKIEKFESLDMLLIEFNRKRHPYFAQMVNLT